MINDIHGQLDPRESETGIKAMELGFLLPVDKGSSQA